ncbi:hypothetical protein CYMTET_46209 [Cymbomonas tetramitiformis]|uniref:Rhodanese domain-containing protein n=1 Tax=Cymbomonas tetramitiformis TaxID=36881 RepID=A0AAE0BWM7_9CHLO|nr:hypothetical protein CYMTET_46209 [Cymbomonas tetramitiformis]
MRSIHLRGLVKVRKTLEDQSMSKRHQSNATPSSSNLSRTTSGVQFQLGRSPNRWMHGRPSSLCATRLVCTGSSEGIPQVSVEETAVLLEADWSYLDVRTVEEFAAGHVEGAVNIPVFNSSPAGMAPNPSFVEDVLKQFPDTTTQLLMGCKSGRRSMTAASMLSAQGYEMMNVSTGFDGWLASGLPIAK